MNSNGFKRERIMEEKGWLPILAAFRSMSIFLVILLCMSGELNYYAWFTGLLIYIICEAIELSV